MGGFGSKSTQNCESPHGHQDDWDPLGYRGVFDSQSPEGVTIGGTFYPDAKRTEGGGIAVD